MEFNRGLRLQKIHVHIMYNDFDIYQDRFMELINAVVDLGIQHLDVFLNPCNRDDFMRHNIYKSKTLVSLKLANVELKNPEFVVSLPCLKILHLFNVFHGKDGPLVLEKLILGCPVLEDLELIRLFNTLIQESVRVKSQTLKRCCLTFATTSYDADFTVEIDAPRLEYMRLSYSQPDSIVMLCCYSKLGPIPIFHNLYHLTARFSNSSVQLLPTLLESCPNLKNLIFFNDVTEGPEQINFTNVPRCLRLTLENVVIREHNEHRFCWAENKKEPILKDKTGMKLVNYFLENSAVLKKLTLRFKFKDYSITKQAAESYKKFLTSTKLSPTCEVIFES